MIYPHVSLTGKDIIADKPIIATFSTQEDAANIKNICLRLLPVRRESVYRIIETINFDQLINNHFDWQSSHYPDFRVSLDASAEYIDRLQIFDVIQALYQSRNIPRDRQIADRLTSLYRDALAEDESILVASIKQFADFFLAHHELGFPKITLTPDGTIRVRWIRGDGDFTAIEFTGQPMVKLVAEIPREGGLTARHFISEPIGNVVSAAKAIGASLA